MTKTEAAKLLHIHISERDQFEGKPLYEEIVAVCRAEGIAGATVFRGLEGFGETAEIHRADLVRSDAPIVITIVDHEDRLAKLESRLEPMVDTGMFSYSNVNIIRAGGLSGDQHTDSAP